VAVFGKLKPGKPPCSAVSVLSQAFNIYFIKSQENSPQNKCWGTSYALGESVSFSPM